MSRLLKSYMVSAVRQLIEWSYEETHKSQLTVFINIKSKQKPNY